MQLIGLLEAVPCCVCLTHSPTVVQREVDGGGGDGSRKLMTQSPNGGAPAAGNTISVS